MKQIRFSAAPWIQVAAIIMLLMGACAAKTPLGVAGVPLTPGSPSEGIDGQPVLPKLSKTPSNASILPKAPGIAALARSTRVREENAHPGTRSWLLSKPANNHQIEGFASLTSVQAGQRIVFYIDSRGESYNIHIYRMGWYQDNGGREMLATGQLPYQNQPDCLFNAQTGMTSCANWTPSYKLDVPTDWLSGFYLAKLTAATGYDRYIIFVVRNDERDADLFFQATVTTYQAYNWWGGKCLYPSCSDARVVGGDKRCQPHCRATYVSFDRPYISGGGVGHLFFDYEFPMVRWLEKEGYDVTYGTNIDTHESESLLTHHHAFLSVGHDEYWSRPMRDHLKAARDAGVSLAFFGADSISWQIRFAASPIGPDRQIICYREAAKDRAANPGIPDSLITVLWQDPPVNEPENELLGVMFEGVVDTPFPAMVILSKDNWSFAETNITEGTRFEGVVGREYDNVCPYPYQATHGACPPPPRGLEVLAESPLRDQRGVISHSDVTIYQAESGAYVFAGGTLSWSWGLDSTVVADKEGGLGQTLTQRSSVTTDPNFQRWTANLLNAMVGSPPPLPTSHLPFIVN